MSSLVGKSVSFTERDTAELSEVSGFSTVPAYLNSHSFDLIGDIMYAVHGLLGVYPVSQEDLESSLHAIEVARAGDLFHRYLEERAKCQQIQIH